ncbi:uncharacterized protein LOC125682068 isoform X2 [Ostrea edulis]|uniref:uncharacterized protein LOC125682068 isoform X2 n=1 Tax=Ostrea edulis TaxID=37623 RepID=UPI0024AF7FAF|nr:uncharacterized protein LOC125682068 isoform X2 [Ostrea edulis]
MKPLAKSKRRSERKGRLRATKTEKTQDLLGMEKETGGDTEEVVSSSLDNGNSDNPADQVELPISPESFLEFDDIETYSDNSPDDMAFSMEELPDLTPGMNSVSLVVGEGSRASDLCDMISRLTVAHEVRMCRLEDAFEACNAQCYLLLWVLIDMPVTQEVLSFTTSIRYASSCNRSTVIIGISEGQSVVDLRLHGIDEMILQPVSNKDVCEKYTKWTSTHINTDLRDGQDAELPDFSSPSTPSTLTTPTTPSTPASESGDGCSVAMSLDSGIESPALHQDKCTVQLPSFSQLKAMVPKLRQGKLPKNNTAIDHTTKEKVRRERIKDSCDQLRVLLPYVRGRKTDMASILEMCVEYLKLVNEALPQEFQNQIADLMTKGPVVEGSGRSGKRCEKGGKCVKIPMSPGESNTVTSSIESEQISKEESSREPADTDKIKTGFKRDLEEGNGNIFPVKRIRIQSGTEEYNHVQKPLAVLPSIDALKVPKTENAFPDHTTYPGYPYHQLSSQMLYSEYDPQCRMYSAYEGYLAPPYYNPTNPNKQQIERDGMYMDNQMLFHFYGGGALANGYNVSGLTDYVNPNAVLPVAYSKIKSDELCEQSSPVSHAKPE